MKPDQNKLRLEPTLHCAHTAADPRYLLLPRPAALHLLPSPPSPFEGINSGVQLHKQAVFADPGNEGLSEWRVPAN